MNNYIITGGSGGIGSSICNSLQENLIYNLDLTKPKLPKTEKTNSSEIFLKTNLCSIKNIYASLKKIKLNTIQGLIFCAGFGGPFVDITKVDEKLWDEIFFINLKSSFLILKEILPYMKKNKFGRIVFIASSQSIIGAKNSVAYSSSKHAVIGLMKSIADEWGEFGITSNAISPGYVQTKMGIQNDKIDSHFDKIIAITPSKKIAQPEEISRVVKFLLSEESSYINGANWTVDGGLTSV